MARSESLSPVSWRAMTWDAAQSSILPYIKIALAETEIHLVAPVAVAVAGGASIIPVSQLVDENLRHTDVAAATRHDGLPLALYDGAGGAGSFEVTESDLDFIMALDQRWSDLDDSQPDGAASSSTADDCDGSGVTVRGRSRCGDLRRISSSTSSIASSDGGARRAGDTVDSIHFDIAEVTGTRSRKHQLTDSCDLFPSLVPQSPSTGFELASATQSPTKRQRREILPSPVTDLDVELWLAEAASYLRRCNETGYLPVVRDYKTFAHSPTSAFPPEHIDMQISLRQPFSQEVIANDAVLLPEFAPRVSSATKKLYADGGIMKGRLGSQQSRDEADGGAYEALLEAQIAAMVPAELEEMDMEIYFGSRHV